MWAMAAMFGLNLLSGMSRNSQIQESNETAIYSAKMQDKVQEAQNRITRSAGALARTRQALKNQLIEKNTNAQVEAIGQNLLRLQDQANTGRVNTRIQAAEKAGSLVAAASAAGVAGSTVDMLDNLVKGQEARAIGDNLQQEETAKMDAKNRIAQTIDSGYNSMDTSVIHDAGTSMRNAPQGLQATTSTGGLLLGAASSVLGSQAGINALSEGYNNVKSWFQTSDSNNPFLVGGYNPVTTSTESPLSWFRG